MGWKYLTHDENKKELLSTGYFDQYVFKDISAYQ